MSNFNPSNENFEELESALDDHEEVLVNIISTDSYMYRNLLEQLESACVSLEETVNDIIEEFEELKEDYGTLKDELAEAKEG